MTNQDRLKELSKSYSTTKGDFFDVHFLLDCIEKLQAENKDFRAALEEIRDKTYSIRISWDDCGGDMTQDVRFKRTARAALKKHPEDK